MLDLSVLRRDRLTEGTLLPVSVLSSCFRVETCISLDALGRHLPCAATLTSSFYLRDDFVDRVLDSKDTRC